MMFEKQAKRLRTSVSIGRVIGEYTKLNGSRKGLRGDCPLHAIPSRTLKINPQMNTFRCSFCGVEGDVIAFLEKVAGLTYGQALEALEHIYYADDEYDAA
jgi:DNA primase